ncbi:MAG: hypothetical protein ABSD03_00385 [Vulcanimicrobiaceae bacterium]|jgi:hypothetical protein
MHRLSLKAVLIGGIVDIVGSLVISIVVVIGLSVVNAVAAAGNRQPAATVMTPELGLLGGLVRLVQVRRGETRPA